MARKMSGLPEVAKDASGTFVRNLGFKGAEGGTFKHVRFYLGRDRAEAQVRANRLEMCWAVVETRWLSRRHRSERPVWDSTTLAIAQAIARGEKVCRLDIPPRLWWEDVLDGPAEEFAGASFDSANTSPEMLVQWRDCLQRDFPMVRLALADEEVQQQGEAKRQQEGEKLIERGQRLVKKNTAQTLHGAFHAFAEAQRAEYSDASGKLSLTGQVALKDIAILRDHAEDIPLCEFDLDAIEGIIRHWCKRPQTKRNKPAAVKTCKNLIKRFRMFIRWLHRAKDWDWKRPEDYEVRPVKIKLSDDEQAARANGDQVQTYTDAELVTLWKYAKPRDRAMMLLALNCGFGIAELSTLQLSEIHLNVTHRKYGHQGSFVMRIRRKNNVYGEHQLWEETVEALRWYLANRPKTAAKCLFVTEQGEPLADQTSGGNRAQQIPAGWNAVVARVRKLEDPSFRKLSVNKLRKTAINAIREVDGGEVGGVFACHGNPVPSDGLIDLYSNRDFRRVFAACLKWGERLRAAGLFAAVASPFTMPKRKHKKPAGFSEKMARCVALKADGKSLRKISQETGITYRMVRHFLEQARGEQGGNAGQLVNSQGEQEGGSNGEQS